MNKGKKTIISIIKDSAGKPTHSPEEMHSIQEFLCQNLLNIEMNPGVTAQLVNCIVIFAHRDTAFWCLKKHIFENWSQSRWKWKWWPFIPVCSTNTHIFRNYDITYPSPRNNDGIQHHVGVAEATATLLSSKNFWAM